MLRRLNCSPEHSILEHPATPCGDSACCLFTFLSENCSWNLDVKFPNVSSGEQLAILPQAAHWYHRGTDNCNFHNQPQNCQPFKKPRACVSMNHVINLDVFFFFFSKKGETDLTRQTGCVHWEPLSKREGKHGCYISTCNLQGSHTHVLCALVFWIVTLYSC